MEKYIETIIVGTGFSGIGAAIQLQKENLTDFLIIEKAAKTGGTWRDNFYPGAACDVMSHLYSFSFELNPDWSRSFSPQQEIFNYIQACFIKHGLDKKTQFNTELISAAFDEQNGQWIINTNKAEVFRCKYLILGTGPLHIPKMPEIKGIENFKGKVLHTARWDQSYSFNEKKIAVIGTGASAIQVVPQLVPQVKSLMLFQRTAPWVLVKPDYAISEFWKSIYRKFPTINRLKRELIYWRNEIFAIAFTRKTSWVKLGERMALKNLHRHVKEEGLKKKLTPTFSMGCKRTLLSNDYYPSLTQKHVQVNTLGIREIGADFILDNTNEKHTVDAIVCATGFYVADTAEFFNITGKNNLHIKELWKNCPQAYWGTNVSGFPNLFTMIGPNTGLGHNSMIYMIESQINYIIDYLKKAKQVNAKYLDVKKEAQNRFNEYIEQATKGTIWYSGCRSWYLTADGKNGTVWPDFTFVYRKKTKQIQLDDFEIV